MKGIELPINVLVIVAIAVIVLLGVVILYLIGWSPFSTAISLESTKNKYCAELINHQCPSGTHWFTISDFDANRNGKTGEINVNFGSNDPYNPNWNNTPTCDSNTEPTIWGDNLASLCYCYYHIQTDVACRQLCGCP